MGAVMEAISGKNAVKRVAKRQINMATRNVENYSALMNGPHQLVRFHQ